MNPREEIESVRQRIGALEQELHGLQHRVAGIEEALALEARETVANVEAMTTQEASLIPPAAGPVSETAALDEVPPLLPPLLPPTERLSTNEIPFLAAAQEAESRPQPPPLNEPTPTQGSTLREWLQALQLWPPSGEENAEVRLAAWWTTRLGALLAVIGIVFLGVYVSREAPPWVRLVEVMAVTAGVIGLGSWLERKLPKFGAVLFGAGLALAYFCAFAAYAVAPMKVITSPIVAALGELLVVGGILAVAWRRGSSPVATMAVVLGHVTAFLALRSVPAFGPWVVLLLSSAAVFLRLTRGWGAPSALALPLAWAYVLVAGWDRDGMASSLPVAWAWTAGFFALFMARDGIAARRGQELSRIDRMLQVTNSTLAVAVGWVLTVQAGGQALTGFYFGSGVVLLVAGIAWRRVPSAALLGPVFFCKGAGLIALGLIGTFEGHTRSLVLLAQAFVMLVSARTSGVRGLRIATLVAGVVALAFYLGEHVDGHSAPGGRVISLEIIFLVGASAFVASLERWFGFVQLTIALAAAVLGLVGILTASSWAMPGWAPAVHLGLGVLLFGGSILLRGRLTAAIAGGLMEFAAHGQIWMYPVIDHGKALLWSNEVLLLLGAAAAGWGLVRRGDDSRTRGLNAALTLLAAGTLIVVCFQAFSAAAALAAAATVSLLVMVLADRAERWPLAGLSAPLLALGAIHYALASGSESSQWLWLAAVAAWAVPILLVASPQRLASIRNAGWQTWSPAVQTALATVITLLALERNLQGDLRVLVSGVVALAVFGLARRPGLRPAVEASWVLWVAAWLAVLSGDNSTYTWLVFGLSWLPAIVVARRESWQALRNVPPPWRGRLEGIQITLATGLGLAVPLQMHGVTQLSAFTAVVLAASAVWRWGRVQAAGVAVGVLGAAAWLFAVFFADTPAAQGPGAGLAGVMVVSLLVSFLPLFRPGERPGSRRTVLRWSASVASLALAFLVLINQTGDVAAYATAACGLAAVMMFLTGLFGRSRPHRLTGLAGLAFCVARAFFVDLDSTLYRIAAFVALGLVLLWVGFSYHRFRHFIVDEAKEP